MKPFTTAAVILLGIVALAHLFRLFKPFEVVVSGHVLPQWLSLAGFAIAGGVAAMLWRESRR